jgi:hypothetical protein
MSLDRLDSWAVEKSTKLGTLVSIFTNVPWASRSCMSLGTLTLTGLDAEAAFDQDFRMTMVH